MITNPDDIELYEQRKSRLQRLIKLDAPEIIIRTECSLVLRSLSGGTRISTIWYLIKDLLENVARDLQSHAELILCRMNIRHSYMEMLTNPDDDECTDIELACAFCSKVKPT